MSVNDLVGIAISGAFIFGVIMIWSGFLAVGAGLIGISCSSLLAIHYFRVEAIALYRSKGLEVEADALQSSLTQSGVLVGIAWTILALAVVGLFAKDWLSS